MVTTARVSPSPPALWNDRGVALHAPQPSPSALLARGQELDFARAIATLKPAVQHELLTAEGLAVIRRYAAADEAPVPANEDREGYYRDDHLTYWISGLGDVLLLRELGLSGPGRLLDFGCSSGRVLRHVPRVLPGVEPIGVDLGLHNVRWARSYLPDTVTVAQTTTLPTLPFEDNYFDAVFAGSVFTHIDDFEEAWLLELRRVLKPGGFACLTFHPERIWEGLRNPEHPTRRRVTNGSFRMDPPGVEPVEAATFDTAIPSERVVFTNVHWSVNNVIVIHAHTWVRRRWGRVMGLQRIVERVHGGHQDGAVLRKPAGTH